MFKTIFLFELKRWFKQPIFYVYATVFFGISYFTAISTLGAFDSLSGTRTDLVLFNSPIHITRFLNSLSTFLYFLLSSIVGASIYRDYLYKTQTILYAYPLRKLDYLAGKFLASLLTISAISVVCLLAFFLASQHPGINTDMIGPHHFKAYLHAFLFTALPNFCFSEASFLP